MRSRNLGSEKAFAFETIERNREALALLSDSIFYFGEVGPQEFETAGLMTRLLEQEGFVVTRGISGFPTGFMATFGTGAPVIAIHTEYDANPDNSQQSGVVERQPILSGAPGHCEGHNVNGAVLVASAIAIKRTMQQFGLTGTLKVFGAPAEEQLLSRPYFVRDGYFDNVDVAFHEHLSGDFNTVYGLTHSALVSAKFIFRGESSHAAVSPWNGKDALDAVVLMDVGMAQYREHMKPDMRVCRVITEGGDQPNVIPARASIWWYFRDPTAEGARKLFEQGKKVAEGAAAMTNTTRRGGGDQRSMAGVGQSGARRSPPGATLTSLGMPDWTDRSKSSRVTSRPQPRCQARWSEDRRRASSKVPRRRARPATIAVMSLGGPDGSAVVSVDRSRMSHFTIGPAACRWRPRSRTRARSPEQRHFPAASSIFCSILRWCSALRILSSNSGHGVSYRPLLPLDQKPPIDLHRALMEQLAPGNARALSKTNPDIQLRYFIPRHANDETLI